MKLLLNGKKRSIYFRKNNTAYYKSKGSEIDITNYFKKKGGLKKQYSNLLVEKKIIIGGDNTITFNSNEIFNSVISIKKSNLGDDKSSSKLWNTPTIKNIYRKLLYVFLICKINYNINKNLFKDSLSIKPNITIKIKKIIRILNGDNIRIKSEKYNSSDFLRHNDVHTDACGNYYILLKLNSNMIFDIKPQIDKYTIDLPDTYYTNILEQVTFSQINNILLELDDFQLNTENASNYKDSLTYYDNANNTNLDLLKYIMIKDGLFDTLDENLDIKQIKSKDTAFYCDTGDLLDKKKEEYLIMFDSRADLEQINDDKADVLIEKINEALEADVILKGEYEEKWNKYIQKNSIIDPKEITENADIYTEEYKHELKQRNENGNAIYAKLDNLYKNIERFEDDSLTPDLRELILKKIATIITAHIKEYNNNKFLLKEYNPLIEFYIDQITETIGRRLTTYLSIRRKNFGVSDSKISNIDNVSDGKQSMYFNSTPYKGFNKIFGSNNTSFNNQQKFTEMKPLFDKLKTSELAILVFGYGYSGSGKTYTLFGGKGDNGNNEKGIMQLAIDYFSQGSDVTIEKIYELYNDTYNIVNAVSDSRNPYDVYTKGSVLKEYMPSLNKTTLDDKKYYNTTILNDAIQQGRIIEGINLSESIYIYEQVDDTINIRKEAVSFNILNSAKSSFILKGDKIEAFNKIYGQIDTLRKDNLHIMATANNQSSSRGHLFIDLKIITTRNGKNFTSYLTICDMGGRENPNNLLLETKIYNMHEKTLLGENYTPFSSYEDTNKDVFLNKPYIISKDESTMYTFGEQTDKVIPPEITTLIRDNNKESVISDKYPGILQLYKSFYETPTLLNYFYFNIGSDFKLIRSQIGRNYTRGLLSNMSTIKGANYPQAYNNIKQFYIDFFKCIKQGFYINDSINQLLKFVNSAVNPSLLLKNLRFKQSTQQQRICDLDNLELISIKQKSDPYNKYGWADGTVPDECVKSDILIKGSKLPGTKMFPKSNQQYNPDKISDASEMDKTNIGIGEIFKNFGVVNGTITRKYVAIGCIRDAEQFIDDDKLTLSFLQTVSTSKLTEGVGIEVVKAERVEYFSTPYRSNARPSTAAVKKPVKVERARPGSANTFGSGRDYKGSTRFNIR
tara:strand:+ start:1209 stop:4604 length:3396 start_codon:yes stop_codon:yes gene_type:complete